jgi:hypothetical protein
VGRSKGSVSFTMPCQRQGRSRTTEHPYVDENLEVASQRLGYRPTIDQNAGLHVLFQRMPGEVRARDERASAVDDRDLRVDLPVYEGLGLLLPGEDLRCGNTCVSTFKLPPWLVEASSKTRRRTPRLAASFMAVTTLRTS